MFYIYKCKIKNYIMKIFIIALLLTPVLLFGQDTLFYDEMNRKIDSFTNCYRYSIKEYDKIDTNKVWERSYYKENGQIASEYFYSPYSKKIPQGKFQELYINGQTHLEGYFENGYRDSVLFSFWENGKMKRKDIYKKGKLLEGTVWDSGGNETEYFDFEVPAKFPGGEYKRMKFLTKNIEYPVGARDNGIQGTVYVGFTIETDGTFSDIKIIQGINEELDNEAIRVIKLMPNWIPGYLDGEIVRTNFCHPIRFVL